MFFHFGGNQFHHGRRGRRTQDFFLAIQEYPLFMNLEKTVELTTSFAQEIAFVSTFRHSFSTAVFPNSGL